MADTIESFVTKLKSEGLEQGRKEAGQLLEESQQQADQIVSDAQQQADKIIAQAKSEAQNLLERSRTELELAARDATLKLRESLERALQAVLAGPVEEQLSDTEFLKVLVQDLVNQYAQADIKRTSHVVLNVTPEIHKQLADWAIKMLHKKAREIDYQGSIDIKESLKQAGFEYKRSGATMEITRDSVVEILMSLVGPNLREIFDKAAAEQE